MYNKLIKKMKAYFGPESLIIYSKHCDYYQRNQVRKDDILLYYEYLTSNQVPKGQKVLNDISCCLYHLSKDDKNYHTKFTSQIIENLDYNEDQINDDMLILIYNIIEFNQRFLESDKIKIEFLLSYLMRFSSYPKNNTNFLLFKLYKSILELNLGNIQEANSEYLQFIYLYDEEIVMKNAENQYTSFIKLNNDLLNVKILKYTQGDDIRQTRIFLKDLYESTRKENQFLAIKIGFELYDIYLKENNYKECIDILMNMRTILKKKLLTGVRMNNAVDFYLAIVCRLGYIGVLTNNKNCIENSIKKMKKSIDMFNRYTGPNKDKIALFKNAYSFFLTIIKIDNREKEEENKQKKLAANFKSLFLPNLNQAESNKFGNKFIVNESNFYNCVVDLDIINNMDIDVETFYNSKIYGPLLTNVEKNNPLLQNQVMTFLLSVHNHVKNLSRAYCQNEDNYKKIDYKNKISELAQTVLFYTKNYGIDEILFRTQFIKGVVVDIVSAYGHVLIYNRDLNRLKGLMQNINDLEKIFKFDECTPSYELLCKIKGDFWLLSNYKDTKASLMEYERGYKLLPSHHPKKPIILFNIAYCHFINKNKKSALDYLNRCIYEFNNIEQKKIAEDFYYRPNAISKKIQMAKRMVSILNSSK